MLEGLKRWFGKSPTATSPGAEELIPWAESRQYAFRGVPQEGFVIDGLQGTTAWRLEWGPSQRPYVQGQELRLRAELGLASDLQVVVMNRQLQEQMEKDVFDQYVEGVQTRIDNQTPPEMRWLVMFPKLAGAEMGALRDGFVALGSRKSWLQQWLQGPLTAALVAQHLPASTPMVLMIGRGRLMLRTALPEPDLRVLQAWLRLFEAALREAQRVDSEAPESVAPSTQASVWQASALPDDEAKP
jgi:hypothetical protein